MNKSNNGRRNFLRMSALTVAGVTLSRLDAKAIYGDFDTEFSAAEALADGQFTLPPLPYDYTALEPHIDTLTMQIHHDKHHATYVNKLNEALEKAPELKGKTLEELISNINSAPEGVRMAIRNHGGGHWNHSFFWKILAPDASKLQVSEMLKKQLETQFTSMENFKAEFTKSAAGLFGSGWTWLIKDRDNKLSIVNTPNQDNPMMDIAPQRGKPIIGIDVWEHAYYLKHKNVRADYLNAIWNVIDWSHVGKLYEEK